MKLNILLQIAQLLKQIFDLFRGEEKIKTEIKNIKTKGDGVGSKEDEKIIDNIGDKYNLKCTINK